MMRIRSFFVVALGLFSLNACDEGLGGFLISSAQEAELGAEVDIQLRQEYPVAAANDPATQWLGEFISPLISASTEFRNPESFGGYKVAIIADDTLVNAFAVPGGYTYLSTGLIMMADSCAEIAGVMGHELAHVTQRHSIKNIEKEFSIAFLTDLFLGEGFATDAIRGVYGFLASTSFSRDDETESDYVGLQIAYKAGYNPYGLADFFDKLASMQGSLGILEFFSSHPDPEKRVEEVEDAIEDLYQDVTRGSSHSYDCLGTTMSLADLKAHISSGQIALAPIPALPAPETDE